jgi:predicted small lipoprotein YifL
MWLAAALLLVATSGCGRYGPISRNAYDYATALYSATNGKSADRVDDIDRRIHSALDAGKLTREEAEWLGAIIADARSGEWQTAAEECRALMVAQAGN